MMVTSEVIWFNVLLRELLDSTLFKFFAQMNGYYATIKLTNPCLLQYKYGKVVQFCAVVSP